MPKLDMSVQQLHSLMSSNPNLLLIDVREEEEYNQENISIAHLIPLGELSLDELNKIAYDEETTIVIHCRSGARSSKACDLLLEANSNLKLHNLSGGILAWAKEGYATEKPGASLVC